MGGLFGGSKPKAVVQPTVPPPPTVDTPAVQAAADAERVRARKASGRAATMLSSQDNYSAPTVGTKTLLG